MSDLISRQDAIDAIMSEPMNEPRYPAWWADKIKELPSAGPMGKWIKQDGVADTLCSECGYAIWDIDVEVHKFCPNCGARMEGTSDI